MEIDKHINHFLLRNEKVVLPDLGILETKYQSAKIDAALKTFSPPSKTISFNSEIQNGDNSLLNFIAENEKISIGEAKEKIKELVGLIKENAEQSGKFNLQNIGSFFFDKEKKIHLAPSEKLNIVNEFFGFSEIQFKPIERKPVEVKTTFTPKPIPSPTVSKPDTTSDSPKKEEVKKTIVPPTPSQIAEQKKAETPKTVATQVIKEEKKTSVENKIAKPEIKEKINEKKLAEAKEQLLKSKKKREWLVLDKYFITLILLIALLIYQWNKYDIKIEDFKEISWQDVKSDFIAIGNQIKLWLQKDTSVAENISTDEEPVAVDSFQKPAEKDEINYLTPQNNSNTTDENSATSENSEQHKQETSAAASHIADKFPDTVVENKEAKSGEPSVIQNISSPTVNTASGSYFIIIGSFQEKENALKLMRKLQSQSYKAVILKSENGNFRVGLDGYDSETSAKSHLEQIRSELNPSAWVLNQKSRI